MRGTQFDAYQPTTVLAGQDLAKQLEGDAGRDARDAAGRGRAIVRTRPVAPRHPWARRRSRADPRRRPAGRRPVEPVGRSRRAVNPAGASKIEVVRGPATLLYGSNAIGGLVNVISDTIPTQRGQRRARRRDVRLRHRGRRMGAARPTCSWGNNRWAVARVGQRPPIGRRRHAGRRRSTTRSRAAASARSALAWTGEHGYFGGSYGYDNTKYGIPFVEEGQIQLTPRRQMVGFARGRTICMARSRRFARCSATGSTSTTSSRARRSARSSRTTRPTSTSRPSTGRSAG